MRVDSKLKLWYNVVEVREMTTEKAIMGMGFVAVCISFFWFLCVGDLYPVWIIGGLIAIGIGWFFSED